MTNDAENGPERFRGDFGARLAKLEAGRRDARWWRRAALLVLALGASVPFAAEALGPVPHMFSSGSVISASEINENFAYLQDAVTAVEGTVPSGSVMLFDLSTCPPGWSEVTEARGRAIVGLSGSAGTLRGTVGDALTDMEDRAHVHAVDLPAFDSATSSVAHTHSIPGATTASGGSHNHQWLDGVSSYNSTGMVAPIGPLIVQSGPPAGIPNFGLDREFYTANDGSHTHSIGSRTSGAASSTSHRHSVDPTAGVSAGAATSSVIPYVQLLVCRRD